MKRVFASIMCILLISLMVVSASAAGINENEQRVMDVLKSEVDLGQSGATYIIPENYINQAENFFLGYEMTAAQADEIIGYVQKAIDVVKSRTDMVSGDVFNLDRLPYADKKAILNYGQLACKVVGLTLIYDGTNVVITDENDNGKLYFSSEPIIKVTGAQAVVIYVAAAIAAVLLVAGITVIVRRRVSAR